MLTSMTLPQFRPITLGRLADNPSTALDHG